jgi:hypothetical protein
VEGEPIFILPTIPAWNPFTLQNKALFQQALSSNIKCNSSQGIPQEETILHQIDKFFNKRSTKKYNKLRTITHTGTIIANF